MTDTITIDGARISASLMEAIAAAMFAGKPILLVGAAGSGKSMLARRIAGMRGGPFRCPHHTVSRAGMEGSARYPTGGELARANAGTLFLDEMPEFQRVTLDRIKTSYHDKQVSHYDRESETHINVGTDFYLIAGANSCPCGNRGSSRTCACTDAQRERYQIRTGTFEAAVDFARIHVESVKHPDDNLPVMVRSPKY
jgi:magnesium chelatase family protein